MTKLSTLCYIEKDDKYLMLHRTVKENDVNKDKWIGVGGHFEYGESPEECLLREVKEETGYTLTSWAYRGIVTFVYGEDVVEYMSLYTADGFEGEPIDCDEGELEWVEKSKIETLKLWEGDKIFFDLLERDCGFFSLKLVYNIEDILNIIEKFGLQDLLTSTGIDTDVTLNAQGQKFYANVKANYGNNTQFKLGTVIDDGKTKVPLHITFKDNMYYVDLANIHVTATSDNLKELLKNVFKEQNFDEIFTKDLSSEIDSFVKKLNVKNVLDNIRLFKEIGRASCRERV